MQENGMTSRWWMMKSTCFQQEACSTKIWAFKALGLREWRSNNRLRSRVAEQKEDNQRIASEKMRVEHTMCSVKRCRVVKDKVRYWQTTFRDLVMAIACGLHNLRLRHRPWNYNPC